MKKILEISVINVMIFTTWVFASSTAPSVNPDDALKRMKEGNTRYADLKCIHPRHSLNRRQETAVGGQHPFAVVITCSDSRVPPELVFDQGIGDLFIVRVAGNVCDNHEIGSTEYAVGHLGATLVVVLGHTQCGAVTAVVNNDPLHGCVASLGECIKPAVDQTRKDHPDLKDKALVAKAIEANAYKSVENLLTKSEALHDLAKSGKLTVIGAVYDIKTGKVQWLGQHPQQAQLLNKSEPVKVAEHKAPVNHDKTDSTPAEHTAQPIKHNPEHTVTAAEGHSMILGHHDTTWALDLTCNGLFDR